MYMGKCSGESARVTVTFWCNTMEQDDLYLIDKIDDGIEAIKYFNRKKIYKYLHEKCDENRKEFSAYLF